MKLLGLWFFLSFQFLNCACATPDDDVLLCAQGRTAEQTQVICRLIDFRKHELSLVRGEKFATRIRLHVDAKNILEDRAVVVLMHGLLDSPAAMQVLEDLAFQSGAHVFNVRLPGHFEKDMRNLDKVDSEEWLQAAGSAYDLATGLSDRIILSGHSTGGLVLAVTAASHPERKQNLILFSPAFGISRLTAASIRVFTALGLSGWVFGPPKGDQLYSSSWAGKSLEKLIARLAQLEPRGPDGERFAATISALKEARVLWFDTNADIVISLRQNDNFFDRLKALNPQARRYLLRGRLATSHKYMPCSRGLSAEFQLPLVGDFLSQAISLESDKMPD
jgi:pimeloyl-ACP methyl ester carboxylesterase